MTIESRQQASNIYANMLYITSVNTISIEQLTTQYVSDSLDLNEVDASSNQPSYRLLLHGNDVIVVIDRNATLTSKL
jgi:hypothetical protein